MTPLGPSGGSSLAIDVGPTSLTFVAVGLIVLLAFLVASPYASRIASEQLVKRLVRPDLIVLTRRVITFVVIAAGLFAALSFAVESANVALFALVLATIVAALGVQDLLRDYVSGYYVLLERHIRVGDRITLDELSGTVTEIKLRVTLLRSDEGHMVVVPNSELFNRPVLVHGRMPSPASDATPTPPK